MSFKANFADIDKESVGKIVTYKWSIDKIVSAKSGGDRQVTFLEPKSTKTSTFDSSFRENGIYDIASVGFDSSNLYVRQLSDKFYIDVNKGAERMGAMYSASYSKKQASNDSKLYYSCDKTVNENGSSAKFNISVKF